MWECAFYLGEVQWPLSLGLASRTFAPGGSEPLLLADTELAGQLQQVAPLSEWHVCLLRETS
eukprot:7860209-Alexandrium_andersonii.AAC.1